MKLSGVESPMQALIGSTPPHEPYMMATTTKEGKTELDGWVTTVVIGYQGCISQNHLKLLK
jgi:hypothetical protein